MRTLYIIRTRARGTYLCAECAQPIPRGTVYWRHDPHPHARRHRGEQTAHYCLKCIPDAHTDVSGTLRVKAPAVALLMSHQPAPIIHPVTAQLFDASDAVRAALQNDHALIHSMTPAAFEDFVCERLFAMGLEPRKVGNLNQADGGIDIVFWPRHAGAFPYLGAAQVKHRREPRRTEGPDIVREFAGALLAHPFQVGILVTNTSFTPSAEWYARRASTPLRLRGFEDVRRWIMGTFDSDYEWREIPAVIELAPGVSVRIDPPTRLLLGH